MEQSRIHIIKLLEEAELAVNSESNGLMDREDFLLMIRELFDVTHALLIECKQLEHERDRFLKRLTNLPRETFDTFFPSDRQNQLAPLAVQLGARSI